MCSKIMHFYIILNVLFADLNLNILHMSFALDFMVLLLIKV